MSEVSEILKRLNAFQAQLDCVTQFNEAIQESVRIAKETDRRLAAIEKTSAAMDELMQYLRQKDEIAKSYRSKLPGEH